MKTLDSSTVRVSEAHRAYNSLGDDSESPWLAPQVFQLQALSLAPGDAGILWNTLLRPGLIMFHPELQAFNSGFAVLHSNLGKYNANTLCTAPLVHHGSLSIERVVADRNT